MVTIPTLSQLYNDVLNDLQSQYNITIPVFGKIFLRALSGVQAAKLKLFYLGLANVQKNIWPDTADSVLIGGTLERFGLVKIGRNPFDAVSAQYTVRVVGLAGSIINAQKQFTSDSNSLNPGMVFVIDSQYVCTGSNDSITLRALTPGIVNKLRIGDTLTSVAPIAGVTQAGNTVLTEAVQPLDAETLDAYRAVVLYAFQSQPQGGSSTDYRLWSEEVQGVAAVYPFAWSGHSNEINLFIESIVADSIDGHGTPAASMIQNVTDQIEGNPGLGIIGKRPLGVFLVHYLAVTPYAVDVNISGANPAFTAAQKTAITDSITQWINTVRPFVAAADILINKNDVIDLNNLILQTLSAAPGTSFGAVTFKVNGTLFNTYQFLQGFIPYLNSVTFV
jgi:uncharacterized phage protein gp47/JayE